MPLPRVQDFLDNAPRRRALSDSLLSDDDWKKYPEWELTMQYDVKLFAKDAKMLDDIVHDLSEPDGFGGSLITVSKPKIITGICTGNEPRYNAQPWEIEPKYPDGVPDEIEWKKWRVIVATRGSRAYLIKAPDAWSATEMDYLGHTRKDDPDHDGADEETNSIIDVEETDAEISDSDE